MNSALRTRKKKYGSRTDNFRQAVHDFHEARQRAAVEAILSRMTGKSNELLSYDEVAQKLKLQRAPNAASRVFR